MTATPSAFEAWFNQGYPKQPRGTYYRKAMREAWEAALTLATKEARSYQAAKGSAVLYAPDLPTQIAEAIEGLKDA